MMALGSCRAGGSSSSSSNLSALAPPFTVDKPFPKPNSSPRNLTEALYADRFDTSSNIWHQPLSPHSEPNLVESEPLTASCVPSSTVYGYPDSQLNNLTSTFPGLNLTPKTAFSPFSYGGYSSGIATSFVDPKPYYTPYVSPPRHDDSGSVGKDGASYDLLSNSGAAQPMVPSQVDYTENVAGLEHATSWNRFCNGTINGKDGKWMEIGGTFGPKDYKSFGASPCKSYTKQVESIGSVPGSGLYTRQYFFGYPGAEDVKPYLKPNPRSSFIECSQTSILGTSSHNGSSCLQALVLPSITNSCGSPNPCGSSSDRCASHASSYAFDCTTAMKTSPVLGIISPSSGCNTSAQTASASGKLTSGSNNVFDKSEDILDLNCTSVMKSSPITVVASPASGSSLSAQPSLASDKMTYTCNNISGKDEDFAEYDPFLLKLPHLPLDFSFQFGDSIKRDNSFFAGSSSSRRADSLDSKPNDEVAFNQLLVGKSASQIPHSYSTGGLELKSYIVEPKSLVEKPYEVPESHNPVVDSPCWKGAPTGRFSSFESSDVVASELFAENLEVCNSLDNQGLEGTPNENTCLKSALVTRSTSLEEVHSGSIRKTPCSEVNGGDGDQYFDNNDETINDSRLHSGLETFDAKVSRQPILNNSEVASEIKLSTLAVAAAEKSGECTGAPTTGGTSCLMSRMDLLSPPFGKESTARVGESQGRDSNPMIDINMLVNTMKNLSEVLRYHCTNNSAEMKGQFLSALENIIENLSTCVLLLGTECVPPTEKFTPHPYGELPGPLLSASLGRLHVRKVTADDMSQLDCEGLGEQRRHFILHRQSDDLLDSVFVKDDADTSGNDNLTQAIKTVLHENLPIEQTDCPALLYKNLWLEAEAALCGSTIITRFNRMKLEMDKFTHQKIEESKNVQSFNGSCDVHRVDDTGNQAKNSPDESSKSSTTDHSDNVEASVMDRFHILRAQLEDLNPVKVEGKHLPIGGSYAVCQSCDLADNIQDHLTVTPDNSGCMNSEGGQSRGKELVGPDKDSSIPGNTCQASYLPSTIGHEVDVEASVMARLYVLKNRANMRLVNKEPQQIPQGQNGGRTLRSQLEDRVTKLDLPQFGPYPEFPKHENVMKKVKLSVRGHTTIEPCEADRTQGLDLSQFGDYPEVSSEPESVKKVDLSIPGLISREDSRLSSGVLEGWYDCLVSEWEHISKEEIVRPK
ncbi:hypothetical protein Ancab_008941 [Ancistrocladus abbreviatus]